MMMQTACYCTVSLLLFQALRAKCHYKQTLEVIGLQKTEYIQNIRQWIKDGAKDQFGKSASNSDFKPQLQGLIVFANGSSTPLPHANYSPVEVPPEQVL